MFLVEENLEVQLCISSDNSKYQQQALWELNHEKLSLYWDQGTLQPGNEQKGTPVENQDYEIYGTQCWLAIVLENNKCVSTYPK